MLYAESETRECVDYLAYLRTVTRDPKQNFEYVKPILAGMLLNKADKWVRWYKLEKTRALMRQAAAAIQDLQSREEMVETPEWFASIHESFQFLVRQYIPWLAISSVYDWVTEGR